VCRIGLALSRDRALLRPALARRAPPTHSVPANGNDHWLSTPRFFGATQRPEKKPQNVALCWKSKVIIEVL